MELDCYLGDRPKKLSEKMLQIRLRKPSSEGGGSKSLPPDAVTVACPDHLALSDLPVAKNLGSPTTSALVKIVGRRSRRQLGERVHFCVDCDLPIAVYGRLSPCEHVFCLDCARSGSFCFICEERIQKIQTIKMMEGILICAAPRCLKSFLKKSDFEMHILETHSDLLHPTAEKEGNDSEVASTRKPSGSDSTVQAPPRPLFSGHPSSQVHDREAHRPQFRDQPTPRPVMPPKAMPGFPGQIHNHSSEQLLDNNAPPGFDRLGPQNRFAQQAFDSQGSMRQEPGQLADKQQGIRVESPFPEYPFPPPHQHPNYALPVMMNAGLAAPQFGYPHFMPDGAQPVFGTPYEMARPESALEAGSEQGLLSGFPPGPPPMGGNFGDGYPRSWSLGPAVGTFEQSPSGQGTMEGFMNNAPDPGRPAIFHGDYGRSPGPLPSNLPPPPPVNKGVESAQGGTSMGPRDNKGILAPPALPLPPPPPFPPHLAQPKRGKFYSDETNTDGQGFGWPNDRRDSFGSNQD